MGPRAKKSQTNDIIIKLTVETDSTEKKDGKKLQKKAPRGAQGD